MEEIRHYHQEIVDNFWKSPINFDDSVISKNYSPFLVMLETPMSKLHFMFTMLNINMLLVLKKGVIKGMITKLEFIQKRKSNVLFQEREAKERRRQEKEKRREEQALELAKLIIKNKR